MDKSLLYLRRILFIVAISISLYVSSFGTLFMGLCSGPSAISCWPHTIEWTLLAPCLLLGKISLRVAAVASAALFAAHAYVEIHIYGEGVAGFMDTDKGLDKCFFAVVLILGTAALLPQKVQTNPFR